MVQAETGRRCAGRSSADLTEQARRRLTRHAGRGNRDSRGKRDRWNAIHLRAKVGELNSSLGPIRRLSPAVFTLSEWHSGQVRYICRAWSRATVRPAGPGRQSVTPRKNNRTCPVFQSRPAEKWPFALVPTQRCRAAFHRAGWKRRRANAPVAASDRHEDVVGAEVETTVRKRSRCRFRSPRRCCRCRGGNDGAQMLALPPARQHANCQGKTAILTPGAGCDTIVSASRRSGRVVECAGLENRWARKGSPGFESQLLR